MVFLPQEKFKPTQLVWSINGNYDVQSTTFTTGTWYHVAAKDVMLVFTLTQLRKVAM